MHQGEHGAPKQQHDAPRRRNSSGASTIMAVAQHGIVAVLLVAWVLQAQTQDVSHRCSSFQELGLPQPEGLAYAHACPAVRSLRQRFFMLWAPIDVAVACSDNAYKVVTAAQPEALAAEGAAPVVWCGWAAVLSEPNACSFHLSPLSTTYFAVKPADAKGLFSSAPRELQCTVTAESKYNPRRLYWMLATVLGVLLFFNAGELADSIYFRLTAGSILFASGFMLVLLFVSMRTMPYKRGLAATFALSTSSALAVVRWVYGTWWPGISPLVASRLGAWYGVFMVILGAAVTYWMDDPANVKLMTSIRAGLRLIALGAVYASIADEAVAVGAAVGLAASPLVLGVLSRVLLAVGWAAAKLYAAARSVLRARRAVPAKPQRRRRVDADGVSLVCSEDDYQADLPDEDEEEDEEYEAEDNDEEEEEEEESEEAQEGEQQQGAAAVAAPRQQQGAAAVAAPRQQAAAPPSSAGWVWSWASSNPPPAAAAPRAAAAPAGGRAAASPGQVQAAAVRAHTAQPTLSPTAQAHLQQVRLQQQQQQQQGRPVGTAWSPAREREVLDVTNRTTPPQHQQQPQQQQPQQQQETGSAGKWQSQQAIDITKRTPQQPRATPQRATPVSAAAAAAAAAGGATPGSPMLSPGMRFRNPESGRDVTYDGSKWKELISRGYVVDLANRTFLPPGSSAPAAAAAAAAPSPAGGSGATPRASPATNLRQRAPRGRQQ